MYGAFSQLLHLCDLEKQRGGKDGEVLKASNGACVQILLFFNNMGCVHISWLHILTISQYNFLFLKPIVYSEIGCIETNFQKTLTHEKYSA